MKPDRSDGVDWQRPAGADRPFFVVSYQRYLFDSGIVAELGLDVFALCTTVGLKQDEFANQFSRPVAFWNFQLQKALGFRKPERLANARRAACEAGLLWYRSGGTRKQGYYGLLDVSVISGIGSREICESSELHPSNGSNLRIQSGDNIRGKDPRLYPRLAPANGGPPYPYPTPKENLPPPCLEEEFQTEDREWDAVLASLIKFGVGDAAGAIERAKRRGCEPTHVRKLIDHAIVHGSSWDSPAGALHRRIWNGHPAMPTDQGWPTPNAKVKARMASEKSVAADQVDARRSADSISNDKDKVAALELEFGPKLNAMSSDERSRLAALVLNGVHRQNYHRTPDHFVYREQLLKGIRDGVLGPEPETSA